MLKNYDRLLIQVGIIINTQYYEGKSKSGAVVKHQRMLMVCKTTLNVRGHFKSCIYTTLPLFSDFPVMCIPYSVVIMAFSLVIHFHRLFEGSDDCL